MLVHDLPKNRSARARHADNENGTLPTDLAKSLRQNSGDLLLEETDLMEKANELAHSQTNRMQASKRYFIPVAAIRVEPRRASDLR
jgi:hypothetical protein